MEVTLSKCIGNKPKFELPKKVEDGELYAKYSLFEAHAGNSFCCRGADPSASSPRFQGNTLSVAVGVATRIRSPPETNKHLYISDAIPPSLLSYAPSSEPLDKRFPVSEKILSSVTEHRNVQSAGKYLRQACCQTSKKIIVKIHRGHANNNNKNKNNINNNNNNNTILGYVNRSSIVCFQFRKKSISKKQLSSRLIETRM